MWLLTWRDFDGSDDNHWLFNNKPDALAFVRDDIDQCIAKGEFDPSPSEFEDEDDPTSGQAVAEYVDKNGSWTYDDDRAWQLENVDVHRPAAPDVAKVYSVCAEFGCPDVYADAYQNLNDESDVNVFDTTFCEHCEDHDASITDSAPMTAAEWESYCIQWHEEPSEGDDS